MPAAKKLKNRSKLSNETNFVAHRSVSALAHEITNPLTVIACKAAELTRLIERGEVDEPTLKTLATEIEQGAVRVGKIISNLRSLTGSSELGRENLDLTHFIEELKFLAKSQISHMPKQMTWPRVKPKATFLGNKVLLQQLFVNLLKNATDAIQSQSKKWIEVSLSEDDLFYIFSVTDSGEGISEEWREKMFEPFFTTKSESHGTGIGLSLAYEIAKRHGGDIHYESDHPHTCFVVRISKT